MAKRFIDTGLFEDEWFSELSTNGKLFWVYYLTRCDHAGILKYNRRLMEFQTGIKNIDTVVQEIGNRLVRVNEQLLFCPKFIEFQYPDFPKSKVKQQDSAHKILLSLNLIDEHGNLNSTLTVKKELNNSYGNGNGIDNGNESVNVKQQKPKKQKDVPTIDEFTTYGMTLVNNNAGYKQPLEAKYNAWHEAGWKDGHGVSILNWKTKLQNTIPFLRPLHLNANNDIPLTEELGPMKYDEGF